MSDTAPWADYQAPAAPAAVSTAAPSTDAPWLAYQANTTPTQPVQQSGGFHPIDYATHWGGAIKDAVTKLYNANSSGRIATDLQTGAALVSGAAAPILAAGSYIQPTDENGMPVGDVSTDNRSYTQRKADVTYNPTDPAAQAKVQLVGTLLKPVGDALKGVASVFTSNNEHQEMIADALSYAIPGLKDVVKTGVGATTELARNAPTVASHPDVVAANDLAGKYNIDLTKGQQVAQAATDLGAKDTTTAKALNIPYQLEAKAAAQPTKIGQQYSDHFDTQQNLLADHVQTLADDLRKAGEDAAADRVEAAITEKSPGVNAVNGKQLQKAVDKSDIADQAVSNRLDEVNDLSGIIDRPTPGAAPIADAGIVQRLVTKFGTFAGAGTGAAIGGKLGHPILGAEAGASIGSSAVTKFFSPTPKVGPLDVSTLTSADVSRLAKQAGVSPDVMAAQLAKKAQVAPVAPVQTPAVSPSVSPLPSRTMQTVDFPQQVAAAQAAPSAGITPTAAPATAPVAADVARSVDQLGSVTRENYSHPDLPGDALKVLTKSDGSRFVQSVDINPAQRGQGYGQALYQRALQDGDLEIRPQFQSADAKKVADALVAKGQAKIVTRDGTQYLTASKAPAAPTSGFTSLTKEHGVRTRDVGTLVRSGATDLDAMLRAGLVNDPYNLSAGYRRFR